MTLVPSSRTMPCFCAKSLGSEDHGCKRETLASPKLCKSSQARCCCKSNFPFLSPKCEARRSQQLQTPRGGLKQAENGLKGLVKTQLFWANVCLTTSLQRSSTASPSRALLCTRSAEAFGAAVRKVASKDMASPATLAIFSFFTAFTTELPWVRNASASPSSPALERIVAISL